MTKVLLALLFIGGPMALTQLLYRIIDHNGNKTAVLVKKFPILKRRKFIIQIVVPILFMLIFGAVALVCNMPVNVFFIICGAVIGLINGMSITIMYSE